MIDALGNNVVPVLAISCTFLFLTIWVVMATIDSIYKTKCNRRIKEQLIDRGASAAEIDQIIQAGTASESEESRFVQPVPPVKSEAYPMSS